MGILDHKIGEIATKIMEHLDLEEVTREVMSKLIITSLDMYFVVRTSPESDNNEFVGLAYDRESAERLRLWKEYEGGPIPCKILKLNPDKALTLGEQAGILEVVKQ